MDARRWLNKAFKLAETSEHKGMAASKLGLAWGQWGIRMWEVSKPDLSVAYAWYFVAVEFGDDQAEYYKDTAVKHLSSSQIREGKLLGLELMSQ